MSETKVHIMHKNRKVPLLSVLFIRALGERLHD